MTKIAIIYYSLYGHIAGSAESIKEGIEAGGATCDIYPVAETLSDEIIGKMGAPPTKEYPVMTAEKMPEYDGFMFGLSGRYGGIPAQVKVSHYTWERCDGLLHFTLKRGELTCGLSDRDFFRLSWTPPDLYGNQAVLLARLLELLFLLELKEVAKRTVKFLC